jgi:hypothetical protein
MKELMIHIERAVRPVRAEPARKFKMRRELLAHLTCLYEDELARHSKPAAVQAEALRRFGDPAALTAELQASVPAWERILFTPIPALRWTKSIQLLFARRPGESEHRGVLRAAVWLGVLLTFMGLPLGIIRMAGSASVLDPFELGMLAACFAVLVIANSTFIYLYTRLARVVRGSLGPAALVRAAGYWAGSVLVLIASAPVSARILLGEQAPRSRLGLVAAVVGVMLLGIAALLRLDAVIKRPRSEWTALEIGD